VFVIGLIRATWRECAALLLGLALLVGLPGDVLAVDAQVTIVQPSDALSWRYEPGTLTVAVGTTVTWVNTGATSVTVTSPDGLFDSDLLGSGASFSHTFDTPGTFRYFCVPYPYMKGLIVVTP
jgi:plastocyanin